MRVSLLPTLQFHSHPRMRRTVRDEQRRHIDGGHRRDHTDPERALHDAVGGGSVLLRLLRGTKRDARVGDERRPCFTQADAPAGSDEQSTTEFSLQRCDLVTQRRLRDEAPLGRSGEAQSVGDFHDIAKLLEFHASMMWVHR